MASRHLTSPTLLPFPASGISAVLLFFFAFSHSLASEMERKSIKDTSLFKYLRRDTWGGGGGGGERGGGGGAIMIARAGVSVHLYYIRTTRHMLLALATCYSPHATRHTLLATRYSPHVHIQFLESS